MKGGKYNRRGDPLMVSQVKLEKLVDICQQWVEFSPRSGPDVGLGSRQIKWKGVRADL
jgi:hypothetical protein